MERRYIYYHVTPLQSPAPQTPETLSEANKNRDTVTSAVDWKTPSRSLETHLPSTLRNRPFTGLISPTAPPFQLRQRRLLSPFHMVLERKTDSNTVLSPGPKLKWALRACTQEMLDKQSDPNSPCSVGWNPGHSIEENLHIR